MGNIFSRIVSFVALIMCCWLLSACQDTDTIKDTKARGSDKLIISYVGFFNSEQRDFSPSPIDYAGLDIEGALNLTRDQAQVYGFDVPEINSVEEAIIENEGGEKIWKSILLPLLAATNVWLQSADQSCPNCKTLHGFKISEMNNYSNWGPKDNMVLIIGLETLSPTNNGLRSGLGAFVFDTNGKYRRHIFQEYNFTSYNDDLFKSDLIDIITFINTND